MIPILGETVLSIIHGPATTGHLIEVSQFLKRPIDVWTEDRMLFFGQRHNRQKPRLHLWYKSLTKKCPSCGLSSGKAVGHFTLLEGEEPRNPDARSHPENCGFDVVSDQTGYPATALRQVAVQRMLAKLYESRLRGRDHHFQCSHCSVSGGRMKWNNLTTKMLNRSRDEHNGHAHLHVFYRNCEPNCSCPEEYKDAKNTIANFKVINCIKKYDEIKMKRSNEVEVLKYSKSAITVFDTKDDLKKCLRILLEKHFDAAKKCICQRNQDSCKKNEKYIRLSDHDGNDTKRRTRTGTVSDYMPSIEKFGMARRYYRGPPARFVNFRVQKAEAVFQCKVRVRDCINGVPVYDRNYLYLISAYPVWQTSNERALGNQLVSINAPAKNNKKPKGGGSKPTPGNPKQSRSGNTRQSPQGPSASGRQSTIAGQMSEPQRLSPSNQSASGNLEQSTEKKSPDEGPWRTVGSRRRKKK
ncbi:hypothetical protein TKK_0004800 [Trichogramma kaykai]|uniref:Uncharacterized protein n=1 Tax=Trichogramma kaykai TaxID=54128 RepID=A0ABD2XJP9_9HYME